MSSLQVEQAHLIPQDGKKAAHDKVLTAYVEPAVLAE
jgi:hypothetical protein